jgi:hypothetical protein
MKGQPLDHLLDRCLQDLARTGDVEATLRSYRREADRLRPLLTIAATMSNYYTSVPDPPGSLAAGRKRLLDAAARQQEQAQPAIPILRKRRPKMKFAFAAKLISTILAIVVGTTAIGGGVALAADDSLPGDSLYPVKLTIEDIRLNMALTPGSQVDLALQFAEERTQEIKRLAGQEQPVPDEVVARMEQHIQRAMNQAAWASEEEMPGLLERIAQRTQTQAQTLEQLHTRVQVQNQTQLQAAQQVCQQAHEQAMAGLASPQAFRSRYQQRDGMPEEITPPEPPTREPQNNQGGSQGTGGPDQNPAGTPQGGQQGNEEQGQNQQQEQNQNQQQEQNQNQQQDKNRARINSKSRTKTNSRSRTRTNNKSKTRTSSKNRNRISNRSRIKTNSKSKTRASNKNRSKISSRIRKGPRVSTLQTSPLPHPKVVEDQRAEIIDRERK